MGNVDFTYVLEAFLEVHGSRHLTRGSSQFENVVISLVLKALLSKCLNAMNFQTSELMVLDRFYR